MTPLAHKHSLSATVAARVPFYYGWVMLGLTIAATFAYYSGQTVGIAEFNAYFLNDLGLSQTELSGAYMLATFLAGMTGIFAGAAMDRYGLRRTIVVCLILMGVSCVLTSRVNGLGSLFLAFLLLRTFGHGALPLLVGNTLPMWFHRRLGFVTGISGVAGSAVMALVPISYLWLIQGWGWRWAWVMLGLGVCAVMLPIILLLYRNHPREVGQQMDGAVVMDGEDVSDAASLDPTGTSFELIGAAGTRAFWILLALGAAHGMIFAAVMFHRVQIFESHGLSGAHGAVMVAVYSGCLAATQLVAGVLADRVPMHLLACASSLIIVAALLVLACMDGLIMAYAFGAMYGVGTGVEVVCRNTMWPRYFGRRHLGKIKGAAMMATVIGSSFGPFLMGWTFDQVGRYDPAIWLLAGAYGAVAIALLFAQAPVGRARRGSPTPPER